jgi:hypothetical protein
MLPLAPYVKVIVDPSHEWVVRREIHIAFQRAAPWALIGAGAGMMIGGVATFAVIVVMDSLSVAFVGTSLAALHLHNTLTPTEFSL